MPRDKAPRPSSCRKYSGGVAACRDGGSAPIFMKRGRPAGQPLIAKANDRPAQRLENWKLRRAFLRPYFLRSTTRLSRVRKPAALSGDRSAGS